MGFSMEIHGILWGSVIMSSMAPNAPCLCQMGKPVIFGVKVLSPFENERKFELYQ